MKIIAVANYLGNPIPGTTRSAEGKELRSVYVPSFSFPCHIKRKGEHFRTYLYKLQKKARSPYCKTSAEPTDNPLDGPIHLSANSSKHVVKLCKLTRKPP